VTHPKPGRDSILDGQRGPRLLARTTHRDRTTWFVFEDRILVADEIMGLMGGRSRPVSRFMAAPWYGDEPRARR